MATLWETITGNSTLPVQAGTNFWDHLNNQDGSGGGPTVLQVIEADVEALSPAVELFAGDTIVDIAIDGIYIDALVDDALEADVESDHVTTV